MRVPFVSALVLIAASAFAGPAEPSGGSVPQAASTTGAPAAPMPATVEGVVEILSRLDEKVARARRRLEELSRHSDELQQLNVVRGRAYVRLARAGLLPVGGGFDALVDHAARLERLRRALVRDLDAQQRLAAERRELDRGLRELSARRESLEVERATLERSRAVIAAAEEREQAFRRAFQGGWTPARSTVYGSTLGPAHPSELAPSFSEMKGRLPFPVAGRTEIREVSQARAAGRGLEMSSAVGAVVRAVYPGRIAFAGAYGDYGGTVIVDHGAGYHTLSGRLRGIAVEVGQEVAAGDRLGNVDGGGAAAGLHFEIRRHGEHVDAAPWFGI